MAVISHWFTAEADSTKLFSFQTLRGLLIPSASYPERVVYRGVDGIGYWFDGERGKPFTIRTMCDFASSSAAFTEYNAYVAKIGAKLDLYYLETKFATVAVSAVNLDQVKRCATTVGGINVASGTSSHLVNASWTIEALP